MRLPLNWLKEFIDYGKKTPQELAEIFTLLGHEVEKVEEPGKDLRNIFIGKILKVEKHPNADKLRIAETKIGNKIYKIVCGGSNMREGMTTVVALPGARVRWHGQGDLVPLAETEIRGVKSVGMICASNEIGLGALFPGAEREIIDLTNCNLKDGEPLAHALGLDTAILHLDITPNRADCFSVVGLARELGAATHKKLRIRNQELGIKRFKKITRKPHFTNHNLQLTITNQTLCPMYTAQVFTDVQVGESPLWMKTRLWTAGIRPINNLVDITNYIMIEVGQPMHVFDLDKLKTQSSRHQRKLGFGQAPLKTNVEIIIRNAKKGEKLKALDGNTYELDESMLVVADAEKVIALAGIMGGEETGVTNETKSVIFEAAIFDPVSVRKTSRKLGLRSESSGRFEKSIASYLPELAQTRVGELVQKCARGTWRIAESIATPISKPISFSQTVTAINQMLHLKLTVLEMQSILQSLGFTCSRGERFRVTVPPWRLDIKIPEDLYEEVGRVYGLNNLATTLPHGELKPAPKNAMRELVEAARDELRALGYDEVYTYSFYGLDTLQRDGETLEREPHMILENPMNPSQELLRTNIARNLLDAASRNARLFEGVKIFEIGKVFLPDIHNPGLQPREETHLACVLLQKGAHEEQLFRKAKGDLLSLIGKQKKYEFHENENGLVIYFDHTAVGKLAFASQAQKAAWKIKDPVIIMEFDLEKVLQSPWHELLYQPVSEFPQALRDIAFVVSESIRYEEIEKLLRTVDPLVATLELFDMYRGKSIGAEKKSLAFHVTLQAQNRTLSDVEIDTVMRKMIQLMKERFKAEVRV